MLGLGRALTEACIECAKEHMLKFYKTFDDIKNERFDGMVVTGAPVENMEFEQVDYWDELCRIFEWSKTNVYSSFFVCWGAQAALYYKYGLKKYQLDKKMFGVFEHVSLDTFHPLMRGLDDKFWVPHSRHTEVRRGDIALIKDLQILSYSERSGIASQVPAPSPVRVRVTVSFDETSEKPIFLPPLSG